MATPVLLAEIHRPFQELGRAALGRKRDARRDEQRSVAVVPSSGVAKESLNSLLSREAHRVDRGDAVRSVSAMPGRAPWIAVTIDGVVSLGLWSFSVIPKDSSGSRPVALSSVASASPIVPFDNNIARSGNTVCPGWSGSDQPRPGDFDSAVATPVTSPTSTRNSPI